MKKQNDGLEIIIEQALAGIPEVGKWQREFIKLLFRTILLIEGKVNFSSLNNHSVLNIKKFGRGFRRNFDFEQFSLRCIKQRLVQGSLVAIKKSGKHTEGIGYFYNGCVSKGM